LNTQKKFWRFVLVATAVAFVVVSVGLILLWRHLTAEQQVVLGAIFNKYFLFVLLVWLVFFVAIGFMLDWFFRFYMIPVNQINEQLRLLYTVNPDLRIHVDGCRDVVALVDTLNDYSDRQRGNRQTVEKELHSAKAQIQSERNVLASLLEDLPQGILVCAVDGRIVFYNRKAMNLLTHYQIDGRNLIGLGRSVFAFIDAQLITRALDRLGQKLALGQTSANERFLIETHAKEIIAAEIVPVLSSQQHISGFILYIEDQAAHIQKEKEMSARIQAWQHQLTQYISVIKSTAEILVDESVKASPERDHLVRLLAKEADLAAGLLTRSDITAKWSSRQPWPLTPMDATEWVHFLSYRASDAIRIKIALTSDLMPVQISVDIHHLTCALLYIFEKIKVAGQIDVIHGRLFAKDSWVYLDLTWQGAIIDNETIVQWKHSVPSIEGTELTLSLNDILQAHGARLWNMRSELPSGHAGLRILIPILEDDRRISVGRLSAVLPDSRPEFYDFDLFQSAFQSSEMDNRPLKDLVYTVFDTETTGLDPHGGDEIVSIAALRIINGRMLRTEHFDQLINPQRTLPWASIKFHGIRPEMLIDQPCIEEVLPRFYQFVQDTVLIGHNVAFDMRMLQMKEEQTGIRFRNPLLDTMLLSDIVHPALEKHGLKEVADRLGVRIIGRHTALGDATATGEIFLKLIPLLNAQGIRTLKEARLASQKSLFARMKY